MSSPKPHIGDIAIIGGGISGVTLAIALLHRGIESVQVYEQAKHFGEIGAGVAFNPAATRAMRLCSPVVHAAFEEVSTRNQAPEKGDVWFDWLDGRDDQVVGKERGLFSVGCEGGNNAVHRYGALSYLMVGGLWVEENIECRLEMARRGRC